MDFRHQMHASFDEYEEEDDVLYDELRRQVMLLTAEDEDDDKVPEARKQGGNHGPCSARQPPGYHGWPGIKEGYGETPAWMLSLWRSGHGTGVFIPQIVPSRRKNRSRRKNERGRTYQRAERIN